MRNNSSTPSDNDDLLDSSPDSKETLPIRENNCMSDGISEDISPEKGNRDDTVENSAKFLADQKDDIVKEEQLTNIINDLDKEGKTEYIDDSTSVDDGKMQRKVGIIF